MPSTKRASARGRTGAEVVNAVEATGRAVIDYAAVEATPHNLPVAQSTAAIIAPEHDKLVEQSQAIVRDALSFPQIAPGATECPKAWIDELGEEAAQQKFRLCQAAWLPSKAAPSGLQLANEQLKARARIEAAKKSTPGTTLNVAVQVIMAPRQYEEVPLDHDE